MAYNSGYNPDALPAHAEPEQAAQILSQHQEQPQRKQSNPPHPPQSRPYAYSNPPHPGTPPQNYQAKPPPPLPRPAQQNQAQVPPRIPPGNSYSNQQSYVQPQQPYGQPQSQIQQNYNQNQQPYIQPQSQNYNASPPPPNYGFSSTPQLGQGRPPPPSRPPGTPAPGSTSSSTDASLFPLFKAVDKDGTGHLTERELSKALVNGDFTSFDTHTVKMMIRMFDVDKSGTINFDEFCGLWGFLAAWRALFDRFDEDNSGHISFDEYTKALVQFGYRLSPSFVNLLYTRYDKSGEGNMSFDLFVQSCIILKRMTDVFKRYDDDRDGYITLSFEEFLTEVLRQR